MRLSPQEIERLPQVEGVLNYLAPLALGDASSVPFADFVASDLVYRLIWRGAGAIHAGLRWPGMLDSRRAPIYKPAVSAPR